MIRVLLQPSSRAEKKWMVTLQGRTIHFGASGYSDYTMHKDAARMRRYDARHARREDWTRTGLMTPGFWAKWILWSEPSLSEAVSATARRFGMHIVLHAKRSRRALGKPSSRGRHRASKASSAPGGSSVVTLR